MKNHKDDDYYSPEKIIYNTGYQREHFWRCSYTSSTGIVLLGHEIKYMKQFDFNVILLFVVKYVWDYLKNLFTNGVDGDEASQNIGFEKDAYATGNKI
ncbi:hypothetical protein A3M41_06865 [Salmonella enterica]|nr:hypothetical protein [Salmonella enterica]EBN0366460.1 hypothetical protein [Salmonella enterica subsp. enterica serovar Infantis]EDW2281929.1 hypothetical protein [Salmonella enterica subsp. enterica]EAZ0792585.1 hypothetical protein [Salmonella enterica]EBA7583900.1 hypothetical protein [Salmonella enterica]